MKPIWVKPSYSENTISCRLLSNTFPSPFRDL